MTREMLITASVVLVLSQGGLSQESSLFHNPRIEPQQAPPPPMQQSALQPGMRQMPMQDGALPSMNPQGAAQTSPMYPNGLVAGQTPPTGQTQPYQQQFGGAPMAGSYYYLPKPPQRILRIHDVVEIRVDEAARMIADGNANMIKNGIYDAILQNWLALDGLDSIKPAPMTNGEPAVTGQTNQTFRANSSVQTRESLVFNIAAEIIDIRPNGNVVLQARKRIGINDNRWEIALTGECQARAIGPDNVVFSKSIINLDIEKREAGQARDGYRRGWFTEFLGRFQPF